MSPDPLAARLFPGVPVVLEVVEGGDGAAALAALRPEEAAVVAAAAPRRQLGFARGRQAAHAALARAGAPALALVPGLDRAPRWPSGYLGSISHTEEVAVAVVARRAVAAALGVDVERRRALEPRLWPMIATAGELAWLSELQPAERGAAALRLFCVKEAVYKAWSGLGAAGAAELAVNAPLAGTPPPRRVLEFAEVEVAWPRGTAQVLAAPAVALPFTVLDWRDRVLAGAWLPA
jgi:hypothetical protein